MKAIEIEVTQDFVCPWCWIGHAHLKAALQAVSLPVPAIIRYQPFELNPTMPLGGIARSAYRKAKFGSVERGQALDANVAQAGARAGVEFNFERITVTPNSRLAHRLMVFAVRQADPVRVEILVDALFAAYFNSARDIGQPEVLIELAEAAGYAAADVREFLASNDGKREVIEAEQKAQYGGIHAVPTFRIAGTSISGAQPVPVLAQAIVEAASSLAAPSAH